jgi:ankyrin repeat protein
VVDAVTAADETALMMAALRGHLDWAKKLVARGAAVNRPGWTPLHYAASDAGTPVVAWLLAQGAALDAASPTGNTALMMAARYGASESVDLLLARGADPRPKNQRGLSAAELARGAGRDRVADQIAAAERAPR